MRSFFSLTLLCAVTALGGCGIDTLENFDFIGSLTQTNADGSSTVTSAEAGTAKPEAFICPWALAAGIPSMQFSAVDDVATKRSITTVLGAYNVTCNKPAETAASAKAAASKSTAQPVKAAKTTEAPAKAKPKVPLAGS